MSNFSKGSLFAFFVILSFIALSKTLATENNAFKEIDLKFTEKNFSGLVMVAHGEHILYSKAFGYSNREKKIQFDENTVFDIGSITKQFVAASIVKLSEEGKLSVEDDLTKYFQGVPKDKKTIKLHHLLTHTAGFPASLSKHQLYDVVPYKRLPLLAFKEKLKSLPGEKYRYSNIGYSLLARVLEKVTKKNWEHYINENLLKKAGMFDTGYRVPKFEKEQLAVNYGADQNAFQRLFSIEAKSRNVGHSLKHLYDMSGERWMEGAGGFMSTIKDMHLWYLTLSSQAILNKKSWSTIFTPYAEEGDKSHYGYGWAITTSTAGNKLITHNGSNGYSFADFKYYPNENLFVFVATNDIDNYPNELMDRLNQVAITEVANK